MTDNDMLSPIQASMTSLRAQQGAASDKQLRENGISARRQERMVASGLLRRHRPGVVVDAGTEETWHRRAMAATLAPGADAVLNGASAALLHGLDGFADIERIIVTVAPARLGHRRSLVERPRSHGRRGP